MTVYVSTRGLAARRDFEGVLLAGLAEDGGLFVPEAWPQLGAAELMAMRALDYPDLAARFLAPFTAGCLDEGALRAMARDVYGRFGHAATAPLVQLGADDWLLELFHGPTLAFKDMAMQLLAAMLDAVLARRGQRLTIVGATSGDTGAAAVRAFAGNAHVRIAMLHPAGRISAVQRRQMTTEMAANVLNIAVEGTFDDCQDLVKAMFADTAFRERLLLSAVNSINWARVIAQSVYYVWAALRLGGPDRAVAFCVPSGNFGNVYAGWVAARCGLPVERLLVATNVNDILARFLATGRYARGEVVATASPSMDIQVASNFERLLLVMEEGDPARVRERMESLRRSGGFALPAEARARTGVRLDGGRADEAETAAAMRAVLAATDQLVDPHTAVGLHVARTRRPPAGVPVVTLATAHPAKFPDAVLAATGRHPALPRHLADLMERPERCIRLPADLATIQATVTRTFGPA
jgi:threonine synthase